MDGGKAYGADYRRAPRRRGRHTSFFTSFFLFAAFLLLLLVGLSLPIIKAIYLFELKAGEVEVIRTSVGTSIRFGVWGYCINSAIVPAGIFTNNGSCQGPQLGYTVNSSLFQLVLGVNSDVELVLQGLTALLVLHPISAGLSLLTALPVYLSCCMFHNVPWIIALIVCIINAIVSTVVLAADIALVLVARSRLASVTQVDLTINWGNGVWIVLAAVVCTWISLILLSVTVCRCCGRRKTDTY